MTRIDAPSRNPMVWLIVGLPLAVIVAGFVTLYLASSAGGTDAVADNVRRTAQIQVAELGPDEAAARMRLSAVLRINESSVEVLPATGVFDRTASLRLSLRHPTRAGEDVTLTLEPTATGWNAAHALDGAHDWVVQLAPGDTQWRLHARLPARARSALLSSAFSSPASSSVADDAGKQQ